MSSIAENVKIAAQILHESGISEPRREANSLMAFALRKDKAFLIAHPEYELSREEQRRFQQFLRRRAGREPFQHITGKQEFFGLDFIVTRDVLIPRPETELIVENAIEILRDKENPVFGEVGVGSGCISVSILHEVKTATALGLEISEKAIEIARLNAENNQVSKRLNLKISDVFAALQNEKFDLIVSNPPYISRADIETLQPEVKNYDPPEALTDGADGLSIIEEIIREAPRFLKPEGFLLLEIGINQADKVREMLRAETWQSVEILPDLQGIPRTVKARRKNV
ncbi:MAG TPA: peptide chain release factor N(5)-glutamine methyltransferase [Pyrinomonadaceae bacterium]|jgi:release factor glutamine methyltransferase